MKISELQELLEKAKEEYGDVEVKIYDCGVYIPASTVTPIDPVWKDSGIEIC